MQRYTISTPLVAIQLCPSDTDKAGVISSLPSGAIVEAHGPSSLGKGMVEVAWQCQRYAVFELDLTTRATTEFLKTRPDASLRPRSATPGPL